MVSPTKNVHYTRFYPSYISAQCIKKEEKSFDISSVVAGVGIEPHDLRVMSPTSYQLLYPAILDCKYTDNF